MNSRIRSTEDRPSVPTAGGPRPAGGRALRWTALLALLAVAAACERPEVGEEVPQEGTPAPPADLTDPMDMNQRDAALAYARGLTFAAGDDYHWAWDKQHLDVVDTDAEGNRQVVRGPLGTIWPEVNSYANSPEALQRGRILAKFELDAPYAKLGLPAGVSYVWVNEVPAAAAGGQTGRTGEGDAAQERPRYRAVLVPENRGAEPVERDVDMIDQEGRQLGLALARWRWSADDENAWFTCRPTGCCEIK